MTRPLVQPLALGPNLGGGPILSAFFPLGSLLAYAKVHHGGELAERFEFAPVTPFDVSSLGAALRSKPRERPAIYLFSSYVWNHETNARVAGQVRRLDPEALLVLGGPHAPRSEPFASAFLRAHPMFDVVARAEGELTLAELLSVLAHAPDDTLRATDLSAVAGISFRRPDGAIVRTPDRPRSKDLSLFPSPYTSGEFDHWRDRLDYMPVETNRGCPYGCTFCDWGAATLSKVHPMSLERVLGEIEFAARNRVRLVGFCDANFGILPRDIDIARHVVEMHARHGYPQEVGYTNAKVARPWLLEIYKLLRDAGLIRFAQISMQTTDPTVLENVKRSNIKTEEYEKMIAFFHAEDIPVSSDVMVGLPGQNLATLRADLQFFFDRKVLPTFFATLVMPNAPMGTAEYQARFGLRVDASGFVESSASFSREDYWRMFELCLVYKLFVNAATLKYLLYFMQVERGVPAVDFIQAWLDATAGPASRAPVSARVRRELLDREWSAGARDLLLLHWGDAQGDALFEHVDAFYAEVLALYASVFGVDTSGSDLDAVLAAQAAMMPKKGRAYPHRLRLEHDVVAYFRALRALPDLARRGSGVRPLAAHGPGSLECTLPEGWTSHAFLDGGFSSGSTVSALSELAI